jgi:hypothetical protein
LKWLRYIPKGKSIDTLTNREITAVENALNHTPRKCLGFRTPDEVMVQALRMRKQTKLWRLIDGVDGEKTEVAASLGVIEWKKEEEITNSAIFGLLGWDLAQFSSIVALLFDILL